MLINCHICGRSGVKGNSLKGGTCHPCHRRKTYVSVAENKTTFCRQCGTPIVSLCGRQKICSDACRRLRQWAPRPPKQCKCKQCGGSFEYSKPGIAKYCSAKCRRRGATDYCIAQYWRAKRNTSHDYFRDCAWCGSGFFSNISTRIHCGPPCAKKTRSLLEAKNRLKPERIARESERQKAWRKSGRAKIADKKYRENSARYRAYLKERRKIASVKLRNSIQRAIRTYIGRGDGSPRTEQLTGCSMEFLKARLESLFVRGMTWKNYGRKWHIDHIVPLASFNMDLESDRQRAFHWSNLQPLEKLANLEKSDKIQNAQLGLLMQA